MGSSFHMGRPLYFPMKQITLADVARLNLLEKIVEKHQEAFYEFGLAIMEIRDKKLWRYKYTSWDAYCEQRWGWTTRRVNQRIAAAQLVNSLPSECVVENEGRARALAKVAPDRRGEVLEDLQKEGRPATARAIADKAAEKPIIELDETDEHLPVPDKAMPFWRRRGEIQAILKAISRLRSAIKIAEENKDLLFVEVNFSGVLADLNNAYNKIGTAMPHAVCPTCQGQLVEKCANCAGRGVISKFRFDVTTPTELKKIREKKKTK
jgi:hypothetical protein